MCHVPWVCRKLRFSTKAKVFLFRFVFCLLAVDFLLHLLSLYTQPDCRPIIGRLRWGNLRKSHFFFQRLVKVVVILKLHNLDQGERNRHSRTNGPTRNISNLLSPISVSSVFPFQETQPSVGRHLHAAFDWRSLAFVLSKPLAGCFSFLQSSYFPFFHTFTTSRVLLRVGVHYANRTLSLCFRFRYVTYTLPRPRACPPDAHKM